MITRQIGKAMATATTRHSSERKQKLVVFYKALEVAKIIKSCDEKKVIFTGTMRGKKAEISLLNNGRITLNLTVENHSFAPLLITEMSNESDYLAWNSTIRKKMDYPQEETVQTAPKPNKICDPKAVSEKAKTHDVTPLDYDTFRVRSGNSNQEYLIRLLPGEQGGTCDCTWGQYRKHSDGYRSGCSHVQAVYQQIEEQRSRTTSAWSTKIAASRQHRQMAEIGDAVILTLRKN